MSAEEEFINEIYTIDICNGYLIFGGNNELLTIVHNGEWSHISNIFSDSIVYCKFFGHLKFFAVGLDGKIVIGQLSAKNVLSEGMVCSTYREVITNGSYSLFIRDIAHLHIDMTAFTHKDDVLIIGCEDGSILVLSESQTDHITVQGTANPICQVEIYNYYILSCTDREFMVFHGHFMICRMEFCDIIGFTIHNESIYLILPEKVLLCWFNSDEEYTTNHNSSMIENISTENLQNNKSAHISNSIEEHSCFLSCFKRIDLQPNENLIQNKYEYQISHVEKVLKIGETVIFAGHGLRMHIKNNEFFLDIPNIMNIINKNNIIIFTTRNREIYIGDYRSASFFHCTSTVGFVYDLVVNNNLVYLAGESGIDIMEIDCVLTEDGPKYILQ